MCERGTIIGDLLVWILSHVLRLKFVRGPWGDVVKVVTNFVVVFGIVTYAVHHEVSPALHLLTMRLLWEVGSIQDRVFRQARADRGY